MNKLQVAEHFRKALQLFAQSLTNEEAMVIATIYPKYEIGRAYKVDEIISCGANAVGDPQLYRVVQDHISQEDWAPDITSSLYSPIGITDTGCPIWSKPTGAHDAYDIGDVVEYNGTLYASVIDGNVYSPDEYPAGWNSYTE